MTTSLVTLALLYGLWCVVQEWLKARQVRRHGFAKLSHYYRALMDPRHPWHERAVSLKLT